ncbi:MAG TPA: tryptophan synthase subunit alpha [Cyclobacteriaceae bacterium]|nr:tryptophan synthase subunit alpha [Cyclobacteriaceae bacterium]
MKNRITNLFATKQKNILSIFYTAGFPTLDSTIEIAHSLQEAGVDLIEIGIPFSDPIADGPVIQESNKVALDHGMTVKKLLDQIGEIRKGVTLPVILMGYLNPVMQYGVERFCKEAAAAGVDGLILPDMPMGEYLSDYKSIFESHGLQNTFLISPTTSEDRIRKIDEATHGFIYAVSASSTTGAKSDFTADQEAYFKKLQAMKLKNPFLVGFGISNHATFSKACEYASGAIVGSAFIKILNSSKDLKKDIGSFVKGLRN